MTADDEGPVQLGASNFDELFATALAHEDLLPLAHAVFREAGKAVTRTAALFIGIDPRRPCLPRNQAICAGLLARAAKFMATQAALALGRSSGEVIFAIHRCVVDASTSVLFLLRKDDARVYDRFVLRGLTPHAELHDLIQRNVEKRGHPEPNEKRLLESIAKTCQCSGVDLAMVPR